MHPDRLVAIMSGTSYLTTASCIVFVGNIPYGTYYRLYRCKPSGYLANPIAPGLSETQITDIFNSVGRVVCFRMVFDRETGRSKGYGFAEYIDAETAASAVRNLDNYEIMGRKLRVDYSSQGYVGKEGYLGREGYTTKESAYAPKDSYPTMVVKDTNYPTMVKDTDYNGERIVYSNENGYINVSSSDNSRNGIPGTATMNCNENGLSARYGAPKLPILPPAIAVDILIPPSNTSSFPMLPLGVESHPNLTTPDSISKTLATVPPSQLLRILIQMKELTTTDPATATELLRQCPQLSYAIFQSMIMMNLIEPGVLSQLLEPSNSTGMYTQHHPGVGSHIPPKVPHQVSGMPHQPSSMLHQPTSLQTTPHVPTATQHANFYNYQTQHSSLPTHNTHPEFVNRIAQQQQMQGMQGMQEPDKTMLLQRVADLTQEEISRLPTEHQQQVLLLKHRLMTEGMSGHGQQGF